MRHPYHECQQSNYERGDENALQAAEGLARDELGESSLEHPGAQKGRLQTRAAIPCLGNPQQKLAVGVGVAKRADDALVAIHLHRQA
jgi:hypothetical protein